MQIQKISLLLCVALLVSGCSVFSKKKSSQAQSVAASRNNTVATAVTAKEITSSRDPKERKAWGDIVESAEGKDEYSRLKREENSFDGDLRLPTNFTELETQHVKFSNFDPFVGKEYLYYDFKSMEREFRYPCDGKLISNFGPRGRSFHTGVDIKASLGQNIYACFDGVVRMAKPYSGYGNLIVVRHSNGLETVYAHNSKNMVKSGDRVRSGDIIAKAGRTGRATTEHLHFEVRVMGQYINPGVLLDTGNMAISSAPAYIYKRANGSITASTKQPRADDVERTVVASIAPEAVVAPNAGAVKPAASEVAVATQPAKSAGAEPVYHKVVKGDTLYAIALRNKTTVAKICELNGISPKKSLAINQKLRVK